MMADLPSGLCNILASITASITDISEEEVVIALNCLIANNYISALYPEYDKTLLIELYKYIDKRPDALTVKHNIKTYETNKVNFLQIMKHTRLFIESSHLYAKQEKALKKALRTHAILRVTGTQLKLQHRTKKHKTIRVSLSTEEMHALQTYHLCVHYLDPYQYQQVHPTPDKMTILTQLGKQYNQMQILLLAQKIKRELVAIFNAPYMTYE